MLLKYGTKAKTIIPDDIKRILEKEFKRELVKGENLFNTIHLGSIEHAPDIKCNDHLCTIVISGIDSDMMHIDIYVCTRSKSAVINYSDFDSRQLRTELQQFYDAIPRRICTACRKEWPL